MKKYNVEIFTGLFIFLLCFAVIFGEVRCIVKMVKCNWEPIGKAEIFYTVGTFTGTGAIIGYLNIKDN
jgi:hypothetical protein